MREVHRGLFHLAADSGGSTELSLNILNARQKRKKQKLSSTLSPARDKLAPCVFFVILVGGGGGRWSCFPSSRTACPSRPSIH